ncbi:MAG: stress response translation initiation inhibitor YciH [Gammaproteobacteria bacterium]|nr:stress response translation initiation inhibitor YciH [Gammaproteobacteria bacterium]
MSLRDQLSTLVYSTDAGRIEPEKETQQPPKGDGIVRIQRETKGRKGKGVTVIRGLELDADALKTLAKALKQRCGVGGSVKDFTIEIQGDQRDACKAYLEQQGFKVKLAGA